MKPKLLLERAVAVTTAAAGLSLIVMVGVVFIDVVLRFAVNQPITGANEIAQYIAMIGLVYFGLPYTFWRDENIAAPIVYDILPPRVQREFSLISDVTVIAALAGIGYWGLLEALRQMALGQSGITSDMPLWWIRFAIPIAAVLCIAHVVLAAYARTIEARRGPDDAPPIHETAFDEIAGTSGKVD